MTGDFTPWGGRKKSLGWIEDERGCHIWTGYRTRGGYAVARVGQRTQSVSCIRYQREVGGIPADHTLDHYICDNGAGGCCNPHHCRPATQRENNLRGRGFAAERASRTHCPKGHPLAGSNLVLAKLRAGYRNCRTCDSARRRAYRARQRTEQKAAS